MCSLTIHDPGDNKKMKDDVPLPTVTTEAEKVEDQVDVNHDADEVIVQPFAKLEGFGRQRVSCSVLLTKGGGSRWVRLLRRRAAA